MFQRQDNQVSKEIFEEGISQIDEDLVHYYGGLVL